MGEAIRTWSAVAAFAVNLVLAAWCLIRGARSTPTVLMALLLTSFAVWNGFEFLLLRHNLPTYGYLSYLGATLAPCLAFHYSASLAPPSRQRRWAVMAVYSGTLFFVFTILAAMSEPAFEVYFNSKESNFLYLVFFLPVSVWNLASLWVNRGRAPEARVRSLFTYPLIAGLIMFPLGYLEMGAKIYSDLPRLGSLGGFIGGVILAVGVFRHRTVYDALALLRSDAARVLRATVQGILLVDPDGRVVFVNSVAREFLGSDPKSLREARLPVPLGEVAVVRRHGRILEVRAVRSADIFPLGRISLILQDKTKDYEMLQTLAASEALGSLGQAAATLAHEVRNPLTTIRSAIDCVAQDVSQGRGPERRHLDLLTAESRRLDDLLERSLQLGRPLDLRLENCDLNELVRETLRRLPPDTGARISGSYDEDLPPCHADPDLVVQLLANLVRNAVEASDDVRVSTSREGEGLSVRVFSGGARMPREVETRLFEPFVSGRPNGTGLGLAFCRKIVRAHGAEIEGRNVDGGVEFLVRFDR